MSLNLDKAITAYLARCKASGTHSPITIYRYGRMLTLFREYMESAYPDEIDDVERIRLPMLNDYLDSQAKDGESKSTKINRVSCLRSFFTYLEVQREITWQGGNPAKKLTAPPAKSKELRLPSFDEIRNALDSIDYYVVKINDVAKHTGSPLAGTRDRWLNTVDRRHIDARNRALVWTPILLGLREREMAEMVWGDVALDSAELIVAHAKGGKQRKLPMPPELVDLYRKLLTFEQTAGRGRPDSRVFCATQQGNGDPQPQMSCQSIYKTITGLFEGLIASHPHIVPHDLRRICATELFRQGVNPRVVQFILGHSSLTVTMRYAAIDQDVARSSIESARLTRTLRRGGLHVVPPIASEGQEA